MLEPLGIIPAAYGCHFRRQSGGGREAPLVSDTKQLHLFVRFLSRENAQPKWERIVLRSVETESAHESLFRWIGGDAAHSELFSIAQGWIEDLLPILAARSTGKTFDATEQPNTLRAIRRFSAGGQKSVVRFWKRLKKKRLSEEALQAIFEAFGEVTESERLTSDFEKQATSAHTESFILRAQRLDNHERTDAALDLIYDSIDDLMRNEEFQRIESILARISITDLSTDILLGILTATLPAKSRLPNREEFFNAVEQTIRQRGEYEEGLLAGLQS